MSPVRRSSVLFVLVVAVAGCSDGTTKAPATPLHDAGTDARRAPPASTSSPAPVVGPSLLSETGLYADIASKTVAPDVIEFSPRYPLWSDTAEKKRWLALPPGSVIDTTDMDRWQMPVGSKMWKEFKVDGKPIETRLLSRATEDDWWMVSYVWRSDGSDADVAIEGAPGALGTTHDVPSQNDCRRCHSGGHGIPLGVTAIQLSDGGNGLLSKLAKDGRLSAPPAGEFTLPGSDVERAALGYLHANCGHCHNDHTGLHAQSAMRLMVKTTDQNVEQTGLYQSSFGLRARHVLPGGIDTVVVPGQPEQSQLWVRMTLRDGYAMPPIATKLPDPAGTEAVRAWIAGLK